MNWLLVCPNCGNAISRVTPACPTCGTVTKHGRTRPTAVNERNLPAHSVITIVIDALRTGPGRRRTAQHSITEAVSDS
jgi:hypothetical protein